MLRVKKAKHIRDYKLEILFSDGKAKIVDFQNWINEGGFYFLPMKDIEFFKKVEMDESNYSICWPNGADISPDALYEIGVAIKPATKIRSKAVVRQPVHTFSKRKTKKQ
jgi:hypothetical protein